MKKMQRLLWIFVLIFALLLAGCSQPEFGQINNGGNEGEVENGGELIDAREALASLRKKYRL